MIKRNASTIVQTAALAVLTWLCLQVVELKVSVGRIEALLTIYGAKAPVVAKNDAPVSIERSFSSVP